MHEVALMADLVDAVARQAAGRPVALVRVRHASSIDEATLRQAFAMLTEEGPLRGARLVTTGFDLAIACGCGFTGAVGPEALLGASIAVCPRCDAPITLPRTAELELEAVQTAPLA